MTSLSRRLHEGLTRGSWTTWLGNDANPDHGPLGVVLSAPQDLLERCEDDELDRLEQSLRSMRQQVGGLGDAVFSVVPLPAGAEDLELAVDGRPAALVARGTVSLGQHPGRRLEGAVTSPLVRRLHLLGNFDARASALADRLLALGCRAPTEEEAATVDGLNSAERLLDKRLAHDIRLEVSELTLRRAGDRDHLAVKALREAEFAEWGVTYPDVRVEVVDRPAGTVRCRVNDVWLPTWDLGKDSDWDAVVRKLGAEMTALRHWFVRLSDITSMLDELSYILPELVMVTRACYSDEETTACLRELIRNGRRVRNVPRILWLLLEQGDAPGGPDRLKLSESPLVPQGDHDTPDRDPLEMAARVSKIANEESWRLRNYRTPRKSVRLLPQLEERLRLRESAPDLAAAEWEAVRAVKAASPVNRVITRTIDAIEPVRDALGALVEPPRVMASQELPPDADLDQFRVITGKEESDG